MKSSKIEAKSQVQKYSGGGVLLRSMKECGVEHAFITSGSEYVSLHHDYMQRSKGEMVNLITCPYEATAVSMAHGYYLSTGKPQAVLVHTIAGSANALGEVMSAARSFVPMIVVAGTTPFTIKDHPGSKRGWVHWGQDARDQGEIMRQFVKWDYLVRLPEQIPEAVSRAYEVAMQDPQGPVYLTIPREWMVTKFERHMRAPRPNASSPSAASQEFVDEVAKKLVNAERPLVVTKSVGRDPRAVKLLVEVAELVGSRVKWSLADCMNFPTTHPLSAPMKVNQADAILALDTDVPWFPYKVSPAAGAFTAYAGFNGVNSQYTIWGFNFDLTTSCNPTLFLRQLAKKIKELSSSSSSERAGNRLDSARVDLESFREHSMQLAESDIAAGKITKRAASYALGKVKSMDDIVVNEYSMTEDYVDFEIPSTYYWAPDSSNLGWGLGAAMGIKLGDPKRNVIAVLGDGAYILNNPYSAHYVQSWYDLPIFTVILNDSAWGAMKDGVVLYSGDQGYYKRHDLAGVDFPTKLRLGDTAKAFGLTTFTIEEASALISTMRKAYSIAKSGKHVLLDVNVGNLLHLR